MHLMHFFRPQAYRSDLRFDREPGVFEDGFGPRQRWLV